MKGTTCSHCRRVTGSPTTVDLCVCVSGACAGSMGALQFALPFKCSGGSGTFPCCWWAWRSHAVCCCVPRVCRCIPKRVAASICLCTRGAVKCARMIWAEMGVSSCCWLWVRTRVLYAAACVCNQHVQVFTFLSLMHPQPGWNRGSLGCKLYTQPGSNWRPSAC